MRGWINIVFNLIITFILLIPSGFSQEEHLRFRHLTTEDGLPSNYTWSILQDSKGFMWFTTRAGLCRYDGYEIKTFRYDPEDKNSLSDLYVKSTMAEDTKGNIWVGSQQGLNKFNPKTENFTSYIYDPDDPKSISSNRIRITYLDRDGVIWIGTEAGGLNRYIASTDQFESFLPSPEHIYNNTIRGIYDDGSGKLWVGTGHALYQFDKKALKFKMIHLLTSDKRKIDNRFTTITEDKDGKLWYCADKIYTIDKKICEVLPFRKFNIYLEDSPNPKYMSIMIDTMDNSSILWIARNGLYKYDLDNEKLSHVFSDPSRPEDFVGRNPRAIYRDVSGTIWIATISGISIFESRSKEVAHHYDFYKNFQFNSQSFLHDSKGYFWFGGPGGIVEFDNNMRLIQWYKTGNDNEFSDEAANYKIFEDSQGDIWIVRNREGIYYLDKSMNKFIKCKLLMNGKEYIPSNLYDIYEDSRGTIWVGSVGLFKQQKSTNDPVYFNLDTTCQFTRSYTITSIVEDADYNLWIGSLNRGMMQISVTGEGMDTVSLYNHSPDNPLSISNNYIWSVYIDENKEIWAGTNHGLNKYIPEKDGFQRYLMDAPSGAGFIYDVCMDKNGILWLLTEKGLVSFDPEANGQQSHSENQVKQYLVYDKVFSMRLYQDRDGIIYAGSRSGSKNGYYSIDPDQIKKNTYIPPIVITAFNVRSEPFILDSSIMFIKKLVLEHDQNFFSFEFAALDYVNPEQNQYAYMLSGLDESWVYSGNKRFANYTKVSPGDYVFKVKGSNSNGIWNEAGTSLKLTVLPPPWKTWWAITLYAMLLSSILIIILRFYTRRQKLLHKLELEQVQTEKLEELDKMKSRFFTNISHEFRTPLTLILGPVEKILNSVKDKAIASDLGLVQRNARRLQKLINQLLSLSKLESGKLELHAQETDAIPLVKGYVQSFESLAKQKGIELIIEADQNNIKAWLDREKIEAILNNLFSNAFKFTHGGGRIEVQVGSRESADNNLMDKERIKDWLEICIHDTGNGIPQDKLPHIFDRFYQANDNYSKDQEGTGIGLALTRELVELHHGKIFVESKLGTGTMFTVVLPLGKNHLKEEEITTDQQLAVDILQPDPRPEDEPEGASGCQCLKYVDRFLTNVNPKNGNNFRIQKNLRSKKIT